MARLLVAVAALVAMAASFAAVSFLMSGGRGGGGPPAAARLAQPAAAGQPTVPQLPEAAERERRPRGGDSESLAKELARAAEEREQALRDAILDLRGAENGTIDDKLDRYRRSLHDAFDGTAKEALLGPEHRAMLTEIFLRIESVQAELAALGPGARQREIEHIRREMGYTDEEIARMAEVDVRRESRWENGLAYMEERERIVATFEGEALEAELRHVRERYFAREAKTIELEEEQGFFRYERPRVYGRN